jgi:mannose-6-phosphate isomerase-like protein (cupin superfamily)
MSDPATALRSIEHRGARVSVHYRRDDLEVMTIEIGPNGVLDDAALRGRSAWHLVVEGEAVFRQDGHRREVLREQSIAVSGPSPYTITNPSHERLRIVSVVLTEDEDETR